MARLFVRTEARVSTPIDSVMQWSYRDGFDYNPERRHGDKLRERFVFVRVGCVVAAFDGERLLLGRAR